MQPIAFNRRGAVASTAVAVSALALWLTGVAAAAVYPPGGGGFAVGAEGWSATEATCNVSALSSCEASGGHDPSNGNPAGALAAKTVVTLNLAALFESTVVFESPDFTVAESGIGAVHADRQFAPGGLLTLSPEATYSVSLIDRATEIPTEAIAETLDEGDASFAGKDGAASTTAGHTYAISIAVETTSVAALGLLGGETIARFDNVTLSTPTADGEGGMGGGSGGGGAGGGSGSDGSSAPAALSAEELRTLVRRGDPAGAGLSGRRVFVRVRCPKRAGSPCRITAQGRIKKSVRVTQKRTVKVAMGRTRLVALRVKRRFRDQIANRKRLLIVQRVRAGDVVTTYARSRALIRRR